MGVGVEISTSRVLRSSGALLLTRTSTTSSRESGSARGSQSRLAVGAIRCVLARRQRVRSVQEQDLRLNVVVLELDSLTKR